MKHIFIALVICTGAGRVSDLAAHAADPVADAVGRAKAAYQSGNPNEAKRQLDLAARLNEPAADGHMMAILPLPLKGWATDNKRTSALADGLSTALRTYANAKGDTIEIQIASDANILSSFEAVRTNSFLAPALGKPVPIGRLTGLQNADGDINLIVAGRFLVTVTGTASAADKTDFARAVDVQKLAPQ